MIGTGAANPPALYDRDPPSRSPVVPRRQLAAAAAAEDQNVDVFGLRHGSSSVGIEHEDLRASQTARPSKIR